MSQILRFDLYRPTIMPSPYTKYKEYQPATFLRPYICCYWSAAPFERQVAEYTYEIIPDGCTDIVFEYDKTNQTSTIKYYGIFEDYFKTTERFNPGKMTFGIRFYPGSSGYFVRERAKDTARKTVDLNQLNSSVMKKLHEKFQRAKGISDLIDSCDELLSQSLKGTNFSHQDFLLNSILHQIVSRRGTVTVGELSNLEIIGQRRMNRLFEERIGLSPKKFSQVIRFQTVLTDWLYKSPECIVMEDYYDQSHLIKDFKKRIGKKPSSIKMSDFYNTSLQPFDSIERVQC
ncbi:AraC family transcriptional regulator [Pseudalkalibacillus caeni]|uniref:AraC family transcriptional regulator n=1 Tax=Exobacillus caeni TaxID=2574798 RepID=A0A5R9F158_9BACL|nr:helix-turn-helix domain-containing protein [Pseudalkalibacillus caeni]TLS36166.1 AraC family transcriptional regulator [Pseudalkalibacillus caeni]